MRFSAGRRTGSYADTVIKLWQAAKKHDEAQVRELLAKSSAPSELANSYHPTRGTTPLMAACLKRDQSHKNASRSPSNVTRVLLKHGADPGLRARSAEGHTAMHYAVISGQLCSLDVMLKHGTEAFVLNHQGHAPIDEARWRGLDEELCLLTRQALLQQGWLYVRKTHNGFRPWKKRFCVVLACDASKSLLELAIYKRPTDVRPRRILLLRAGHVKIVHVTTGLRASRPHMFSLDRVVAELDPRSKRTFSRDEAALGQLPNDARVMIFAANDVTEQSAWMSLLPEQPSLYPSAGIQVHDPVGLANRRRSSLVTHELPAHHEGELPLAILLPESPLSTKDRPIPSAPEFDDEDIFTHHVPPIPSVVVVPERYPSLNRRLNHS